MSIFGIPASSRRQTPNAPTIGTATDVGTSRAFNNGAATVTFTPNPTGFEATSFTATSSPGGFTSTGSSSPLIVTGLQSNTAYTFTVTATNFVGTGSASSASSSITVTTVPQAPTIGTSTFASGQASTGSANVSVAFTGNATGGKTVTGYTVTSSSAATGSGASSPIIISETVGTACTYTVTATNANGTSLASSASSSTTPASVPENPTITSVTNVSGRPANSLQASVAFTAGATGGSTITSYTVTSSTGATNTGSSSPILVTETAPGTYSYTMTATNAQGTSSASTSSSASLGTTPSAPASLSAVVTSSTSVTLTYGSFSNNGLAISALTGSGTSTGDITSTPAINLTYSGTPTTTGGTLTVTGTFAAATSYTFSLRVRNSGGASSYTSTSTGITPLPVITDNFNRTGSTLGTSSSGSSWTSLRGTWATNGTQAVSSDAGSTYALSSVAFGNANTTVSASVSGGTGVAFWVTDSGSWWAATTYYNETITSTYNSCCSVTTVCSPSTYTINYGDANCSTTSSTTYSSAGGSTSYRYCPGGEGQVRCNGAFFDSRCYTLTYSCPSGQSYAGGYCYSNTYPYAITGSSPTCSESYYTASVGYNCTGLSCSAGQSGPTPGSEIGRSQATCYCGTTTSTTNCTCSQGSPTNPSGPTSICTGTGSCSYPNCASCGGGTNSVCNACYQDVASQYYYLRLYSSVSGTVTTPVSDVNLGAPAAAVKVITSGNNVTAQAYSNTSMATTLGSALTATNTGTKGTSSGIIKTPSNYSQGTTVDDFSTGA